MNDPRGSIWRKCDFHIHTPLSALENNFTSDFDAYVQLLIKKALEKKVSIIGITDYFTIEGYKKIRTEYLENEKKLKTLFTPEEINQIKNILILPNIEFRLNKIIQVIKIKEATLKNESGRINFHVIFSNELSIKQIEESFLHDLDFIYEAEPDEKDKKKKLKPDNLASLGKRLKAEQPEITGSDLRVGMTHAVVNDEQIVKLLTDNNDFTNKYLIVVPSDEDLTEIQWKSQDGLTRKILLSRAHAFFSSNPNTIAFGLAEKSASIESFIQEFKSLKPCIWGSDAHKEADLFEPDLQRYCWLKADATFEGVRQILFEPKDRVYIGEYTELGKRIRAAKNNYLASISISKLPTYNGRNGEWFTNFTLPLGFELTAVIGNKGKGKSAIADIIALLGNAHVDRSDFSFLNEDKFCQKGYADQFSGTLTWLDGTQSVRMLHERIDVSHVERVKYLPQSYLEKLCNNEDGKFQQEINKVVFSRLDEHEKLGKKTFTELKEYKAQLIEQKITEIRNTIEQVNKKIIQLEAKSVVTYKQQLENKLALKKDELLKHNNEAQKIPEVSNPADNASLSGEQQTKAALLTRLNEEISAVEITIGLESMKLSASRLRLSELELIITELVATKGRFDTWQKDRATHYSSFGLVISELISMTLNIAEVDRLITVEKDSIESTSGLLAEAQPALSNGPTNSLVMSLNDKIKQRDDIGKELEKPFKDWQEYQQLLKDYQTKRKEIMGSADVDGSIVFLEQELQYLSTQLSADLEKFSSDRAALIKQVFKKKKEVQGIYNKIKSAIFEVLQTHSREQHISIETSFKIDRVFYSRVFDYINRYGDFYQNGDDALRKLVQEFNFDQIDQVLAFIHGFLQKDLRFKEGRKQDFYNYLSSLSYIDPEYDLRLNGKSLSRLSPGEKGGLLLIFYLVLDKDNKPLIIDQPEDNLDNQSVAEILVPYIKIAKTKRQIIMVTHNPNLAIVADAEQIVYMSIDKENRYHVSCVTGAIEHPAINNHIVDILEGKMKAFNNRRLKYRKRSS